MTAEKFRLSGDDKGKISDIPIEFRKIMHKEITKMSSEADVHREMYEGRNAGVYSPTLPVTYIFGEDIVIGLIKLFDEDFKETGGIMTFKVDRNNLNVMLED